MDIFERIAQLRAELYELARQLVANAIQFTQLTLSTSSGEHDKVAGIMEAFESAAQACGEAAGRLAEAERYRNFGNRSADRGGFEMAAATAQRDGDDKRTMMLHTGGIVNYLWNVWKQTDDPRACQQMTRFIIDLGKAAYETGNLFGVYHENIEYILKYDETAQAAGRPVITSKEAVKA